jgi:P4 family phage/plasmid primase-like protien
MAELPEVEENDAEFPTPLWAERQLLPLQYNVVDLGQGRDLRHENAQGIIVGEDHRHINPVAVAQFYLQGNRGEGVEDHAGKLYFISDKCSWLIWNERDHCWIEHLKTPDQFAFLHAILMQYAQGLHLAVTEADKKVFPDALLDVAQLLHISFCTKYQYWEAPPGKPFERVIPFLNGILELEEPDPEKSFRLATPDDHFVSVLQVYYEPNADCPLFKDLLSTNVRPSDRSMLDLFLGYLVEPSVKYKKACLLKGETDTGKSVFGNLLVKLFGPLCSGVPLQELSDQFASGELAGKWLNFCNELPVKPMDDDSVFKRMTGDSPIESNIKYGHRFKWNNGCKLMFTNNHYPLHPSKVGDEFYGRFMVVHFDRRFKAGDPERDPDLLPKLLEESSGIMNYIIKCWRRLTELGDFPDTIEQVKREWIASDNPVREFIDLFCKFVPEQDGGYIPVTDFLSRCNYETFGNDIRKYLTPNMLWKYLQTIPGVARKNHANVTCYTGIMWNIEFANLTDAEKKHILGDEHNEEVTE